MSNIDEDMWLWHSRLGHVNFKAMILLADKKMAQGFPRLVQPKTICSGCLISKHIRKPFSNKTEFRATRILELIHADLCGPISPATKGGNKYFLLLVDDFSRLMWVYMLRNKDDAFETFMKFRTFVEKNSKEQVKVLRTDRGGEFCSNQFNSYCEENGITMHYTTPYSPQQNGVIEHINRTVVAMTRSFLKEMKLPSNL